MREGSEGKVCQTGTKPGSTAHTECKKGQVLTGNRTRTCLNNGSWSGEPGECESKNAFWVLWRSHL